MVKVVLIVAVLALLLILPAAARPWPPPRLDGPVVVNDSGPTVDAVLAKMKEADHSEASRCAPAQEARPPERGVPGAQRAAPSRQDPRRATSVRRR